MNFKGRKVIALMMTLVMVFSLLPGMSMSAFADTEYEFWDLRNEDNITVKTLTGKIDGEEMTVTHYAGYYVENPNSDRQQINIYVPENATEDSAIYFLTQNNGWMRNTYPTTIEDGFESNSDTIPPRGNGQPNVAQAFSRGMVIVSYGCRSRGQQAEDGSYIGHSPATMTDTKAALRFLRYNAELYKNGESDIFIGDTDYIFVTGRSGGGGLTALLAASGNNSDYFESLYEIGAAGITKVGDTYVSDEKIGDNVFGTLSYCPIIELPVGATAYEWTYNTSRANREAKWEFNGGDAETGVIPAYEDNDVMQASAWYANEFVDYLAGLQLKNEDGELLYATYEREEGALAGTTGGNFKDAMQALLEKGINKAIATWTDEDLLIDGVAYNNADSVSELGQYSSWLNINGEPATNGIPAAGSVATISDIETFLLENIPNLKHNVFTWAEHFNLFAAKDSYQYSPYDEYYWEVRHDTYTDDTFTTKGLGSGTYNVNKEVGQDNTGLTWAEYLKTEDGQALAMSMKMATPIPYLVGADKIPYLVTSGVESSDDSDIAPYWYVRHGMNDSDAGFALETILYYALYNCEEIESFDFSFAWNMPHDGFYDNNEAFAWIDECLAKEKAENAVVVASTQTIVVDGEAVEAEVYNIDGNNYFKLRDIAALLNGTRSQFSVEFNEADNSVSIDRGAAYTAVGGELVKGEDKSDTCVPSRQIIEIEGEVVELTVYNIGGNNFFKLRELGAALLFNVDYDYETYTIKITSR